MHQESLTYKLIKKLVPYLPYRKVPIFRTLPLISDKLGGFTAFLATGKVIDKYKILKLPNYLHAILQDYGVKFPICANFS
jgi:hypothetical protein